MWQPRSLLMKRHSVAKKWNWENCLHLLSLPNSGNSYDFGSGPSPRSDWQKKFSYNGLDAVGPCMRLSLHVSNVTCHKWTFFQHAPKSMDARRKTLNCTKANWKGKLKGFLYMWQPRSLLMKRHSVAKEWSWENCLRRLSFPKGHVWICPFMSQTVILRLFSTNF